MKYYDPCEVATILNIKPHLVFQFISENKLKCIQMGANYRIPEDDFNNFKKSFYKNII